MVHPTNSTCKAIDNASNPTISPSRFPSNPSFLIGELLLGKLSETVVVQGNTPHNRPSFLVGHLIGNRASLLCTEAPMLGVPETNFLHRITSHQLVGEMFRRFSADGISD